MPLRLHAHLLLLLRMYAGMLPCTHFSGLHLLVVAYAEVAGTCQVSGTEPTRMGA